MILSKKFVNDYIDIEKEDINDIACKMVKVGNEFEKCGKLIDATKLVIGKVISCEKHPNSDHLNICKVDVKSEILDIVCGACNVRKDIKVIVALDKAVLPGGIINKKEVLGYVSNGMICSLLELGIDSKYLSEDDINGIHILDDDAPVGMDAIKYLQLDDEIIDFELTSNRSDLLSMIGLAYEIGAITSKKVKEPISNYKQIDDKIDVTLNVNTTNCYSFLGKKVNNIVIKESPLFIKNRLMACGIRSINNVVDISNYVMLETGQPLHFYDADKLGDAIGVRMAYEGEKLKTLDNNDRLLTSEDIVIINSKDEAIALAGVMGGYSTEIDENTKNVFIESAIFNPYNIRYTSTKHLRSEASIRFEKGLDINRSYLALERSCDLLSKYACADVLSGYIEYNTLNKDDKLIRITHEKICNVLGLNITSDEVIDVFEKLCFKVNFNDGIYDVLVPSRRGDISIVEDLIEEVGRIYGVDNISGKLPIVDCDIPKYDKRLRYIKDKLVSLGLSEVKTYSLINEKDLYKFTNDNFEGIKVRDAMSVDRTTLRYSLITSLIDVYNYNKSHGIKDLCIFESGERFYKENDEYKQINMISGLLTGKYNTYINNENVDFYIVKGIIEELLIYMGYNNRYSFINNELINEMHPYRTVDISINGKVVGFFGQVHRNILKDEVYVFEINLDLLCSIKTGKIKYKEFTKYPSVKKDLAFILDKNIKCDDVINTISKSGKYLSNIEVFDYYEGDKVGDGKKSIAYSLTFESFNKTLEIDEINPILDSIIENVIKKHNAILRDK